MRDVSNLAVRRLAVLMDRKWQDSVDAANKCMEELAGIPTEQALDAVDWIVEVY